MKQQQFPWGREFKSNYPGLEAIRYRCTLSLSLFTIFRVFFFRMKALESCRVRESVKILLVFPPNKISPRSAIKSGRKLLFKTRALQKQMFSFRETGPWQLFGACEMKTKNCPRSELDENFPHKLFSFSSLYIFRRTRKTFVVTFVGLLIVRIEYQLGIFVRRSRSIAFPVSPRSISHFRFFLTRAFRNRIRLCPRRGKKSAFQTGKPNTASNSRQETKKKDIARQAGEQGDIIPRLH